MNDKIFKIALNHIEAQTTPEPITDPSKMIDNLSDKKILEIADESIVKNYESLLNIVLRHIASTSVPEAFMLAYYMIEKFNDSDSPITEFNAYFANLKTKLLRYVSDLARSDKKSIKDLTLKYFKTKPTDDEEVVDDYVRELLGDIRRESIVFIRKLNLLKNI